MSSFPRSASRSTRAGAPPRAPSLAAPGVESHKYTRGLVAVVEGAMPGAARLAARAAMAGGAGYVILAGAEPEGRGPDALVRRRIEDGDALAEFLADERIGAIVVGPGLGRERRAEGLLKAAFAAPHPLVLDGDALTLLGRSAGRWLQGRAVPTWLTPHAGEFERMFGEGESGKIERTRAAAAETGATVIHKGRRHRDRLAGGRDPRARRRFVVALDRRHRRCPRGAARGAGRRRPHGSRRGRGSGMAAWPRGAACRPAFIADSLVGHLPGAIAECL